MKQKPRGLSPQRACPTQTPVCNLPTKPKMSARGADMPRSSPQTSSPAQSPPWGCAAYLREQAAQWHPHWVQPQRQAHRGSERGWPCALAPPAAGVGRQGRALRQPLPATTAGQCLTLACWWVLPAAAPSLPCARRGSAPERAGPQWRLQLMAGELTCQPCARWGTAPDWACPRLLTECPLPCALLGTFHHLNPIADGTILSAISL